MELQGVQYAKLLMKIGSLFANCDGKYTATEDDFIKRFIIAIIKDSVLQEEEEKLLIHFVPQEVSLELVASEFLAFISQFSDDEKQIIKAKVDEFITALIKVDGVIAPEETILYKKWNDFIN